MLLDPVTAPAPASPARWASPLLAGVALVVVLATGAAVLNAFHQQRLTESARLQAIADLRASQVARWLRERNNAARFLAGSQPTADTYLRWRADADTASRDRLVERLVDVRESTGFQGVVVLDAGGDIVAGRAPCRRPRRHRCARPACGRWRAARCSAPGSTPPTATAAPALPRLDVVVPLNGTGKPAQAAVALRIDPSDYLFPILDAWPAPTVSGRSLLVRATATASSARGPGSRCRSPPSTRCRRACCAATRRRASRSRAATSTAATRSACSSRSPIPTGT
jgi:hypothetical protein